MSYKASFLDNQVVGVDDFNSIISNLVGAGVVTTDFSKSESYMISKMNDVTKDAIATAGVVPESESSLRCTLSGTVLTIAAGSAVFASGVNFRVTEAEAVEIEAGKMQYVYLKHDKIQNTAMPYVSEDGFPEESDNLYIIPLCVIDEGGAVEDRRKYARGKLQAPNDWNGTKVQTMTIPTSLEESDDYYNKEIELKVGGDRINFLAISSCNMYNSGGIGIITEPTRGNFEVVSLNSNGKLSTSRVTLSGSRSTTRGASIEGFRRDENGRLLCTMQSDLHDVRTYTLYSSVYYEEASE